MDFFTADTHFFHENICGESGFVKARRRFDNVDEMNRALIQLWNCRTSPEDTTYFLGDFAIRGTTEGQLDILRQLNGRIEFIKGNHDHKKLRNAIKRDAELRERITWHEVGIYKKIDGMQVYLTHFPMIPGNRKKIINLHGHIHDESYPVPNILNVGADSPETCMPWGYPLTWQNVRTSLGTKQLNLPDDENYYSKHGIIK